ncbi:MAG: hypothetical protein FJ125_04475 [Deltaproteobacteria bacterium]|nr:hypothetical protein [Deltaproteobacteria bacterium]
MRPQQEHLPANYRPLPAARQQQARDGARGLHDRLLPDRLTGVIELHVEAVDSLRIGSGIAELVGAGASTQLAAGIALRDGEPYLPGSSIKGMLRSLGEAIGGGCNLDPDCGGGRGASPCAICSLFGQIRRDGQLMGRVGFSDALPAPGAEVGMELLHLPRAFQPRRQVGRRIYDVPEAQHPPEVPSLVVPPGSKFVTKLQLLNVRPDELGLLLLAAGCDGTFLPRLGGGKYAGLGRVRFLPRRAMLRGSYRQLKPEILDGEPLALAVSSWLAAFRPCPGSAAALDALRGGGEAR